MWWKIDPVTHEVSPSGNEHTRITNNNTDSDSWRVERTDITEGISVSTVFLGLDHNYSQQGLPILFESLVFGGDLDGEMHRYATWDEAVEGHKELVERVKDALSLKELVDNVKREEDGLQQGK